MRTQNLEIDLQELCEENAHNLGKLFSMREGVHAGECTAPDGYCVECAFHKAEKADDDAEEILQKGDL